MHLGCRSKLAPTRSQRIVVRGSEWRAASSGQALRPSVGSVRGPESPAGPWPAAHSWPRSGAHCAVACGWLGVPMGSWEAILLVIATVGSAAAAAGVWFQERRSSATQLSAIQRKLDLVMGHLGLTAPEEPEVVRHLENGRMIDAVRAYRKQTGASLLESKQAVDRIAADRRITER